MTSDRRRPSRPLSWSPRSLPCCACRSRRHRSFVWKVSNARGSRVYLAGSVHLLTADYYPLAPAFDTAFNASDLLVEELDMGEMLASRVADEDADARHAAGRAVARQASSRRKPTAVTQKFAELGLPIAPLKQFKPWLLALTLQALEWQKAGFDADLGLDKHFYDLARQAARSPCRDWKRSSSRSPGSTRCRLELQERMLVETLKELETTKTSFAHAWPTRGRAATLRTVEEIVLART